MTVKEQLRANFPKTIDKDDPIFCSLIANDDGDAALEYELTHLIEFMREWTGTPNIYKQAGDMLNMTIAFYSFLERFTDETEKSIKARFGAIFIRNHDTIWGTPFDVMNVFRQYFTGANVYLVENTNDTAEDNLLIDGDFEDESSAWQLDGCTVSNEARFSHAKGVSMPSLSTLVQSVHLDSGTYFLHFFAKGKVKVSVKNSSSQYWDSVTETWTGNIAYTEFSNEDWNNSVFWFISDSEGDFDIEFVGNDDSADAYVDYARLFQKHPWASFSVVAHFEGDSSGRFLKLAPGESDPSPEISDYTKYDYFDNVYMSGMASGFAQDVYADLMNLLRAQGVKAYIEIVAKDF